MGFELRHVRAFGVVAEQLHFGRAARQLNISQPALSQQIRLLERDVGTPLFIRTSRMVELTPAGRALAEAGPLVILEAERAQRRVEQAAEGSTGLLIVGSVNTALASITPRIMRAVHSRAPELRMELYHMDTSAQLTALADRRIDIGVVREAAATRFLDNERLVSEALEVVLPEDHPLAAADSVDPRDLADEPFVLWPRMLGPDFFDRIITYCRKHRFNPRIVAEGGDVETQLGLVAAGTGVSLQPAYYADLRRAGVVFRPLEGETPRVALQMSWRKGVPSPAVDHFLAAGRQVSADPAT